MTLQTAAGGVAQGLLCIAAAIVGAGIGALAALFIVAALICGLGWSLRRRYCWPR